jgi:hypothetical protein
MQHSRGRRLLVLLLPFAAASCLRSGNAGRTAAKPTARDSALSAAPKSADTTVAPKADATRTAADSAARDSVARAAKVAELGRAIADSATKRDSAATKKGKSKPAPAKQCLLDTSDSPPETRVRFQKLPDSTTLTFVGGGFTGHCQGEKNQIKADSAEQYQSSGVLNLFGNVTYEEPQKMRITSDRATYFTKEERLYADGNVVATQLASGSTFRGPSIEYLRPTEARPVSRLNAPSRPTAQIIEKDSLGKPGPPVIVTANTMVDVGDSVLFAWGDVQVSRTTLIGESDSASFDKLTETARMIRTARVINRDKEQPFRLFGDTIDIFSKDQKVERVVSRHNGNASNNDVVLQAELIDLRFDKQKLARAFAWGPGRAKATTSTQLLVADSIAVRMPDERLRQFKAIGRAVATGRPDTMKIKSDDRDILRGDTVSAWFDSSAVAPGDTSRQSKILEIHAIGSASSLFQIASKEGPKAKASLNYVRGKRIFVVFDSGQVRDVTVDSAASGMFLEPAPDSLSDSTKRPTPTPPRRPPVAATSTGPAGPPDGPEFPVSLDRPAAPFRHVSRRRP